MVAAKPDCSGQRFGSLTVIRKTDITHTDRGGKKKLWELQCDCGKIIAIPRSYFDRVRGGQRSCGCMQRTSGNSGRKRQDITGQRFGSLVAIAPLEERVYDRPSWLLRCDCGNERKLPLKHLSKIKRPSCGDRNCGYRLHYPPTPNPYPEDAGAIAAKYLRFTKTRGSYLDQGIEDERTERLRYSPVVVFWRRKVEQCGGLLYDSQGRKNSIGDKMTDLTSQNYPVIETSEKSMLPMVERSPRRLKFRRC
ncbi:hypothetical protein HY772_05565 [Candidatus Woesearchaeota archaeon]|nr:hypothetical protein [Candidatus Woesearchaeota archaeon]